MEEKINKILEPKIIQFIFIFFIFLVVAILCIGIAFYEKHEKTKNPLNLAEQISNKTEKEEQYIIADIAYLPQLIIKYDKEESSLYFVKDKDDHLYIARLSDKTFDHLKSIYNEETKKLNTIYRLKGFTYSIDSQMKTFILRGSNKLIPEIGLTSDNFSQHLGTVYIYENKFPISDDVITIYKISSLIGVFLLVMNFIFIFPAILKEIKFLKNKDLINNLKIELRDLTCNPYGDIKLYLTENYIFSISVGKHIIKYEDIIWVYIYENGVVKNLTVCTKDKKKHTITEVDSDDNILENVISDIQNKNANIRIGYTEENKEFLKNFKKSK